MIPTGLSVKVLGQKLNIAIGHLNGISKCSLIFKFQNSKEFVSDHIQLDNLKGNQNSEMHTKTITQHTKNVKLLSPQVES